jgi:DNA repair exonuclease SbcCD ATPase subunit
MERLLVRKKVAIVRLYLSGLSYDEIAAKSGVSKGTVANVVTDLKAGRFPEAADVGEQIELLRELSLDLKRSKLTLGQCAIGLTTLTRINECGLDPADIDRWPSILKEIGSEEQAREFVRLVYSIQEVRKNTGLSLEELDDKVHELERKAAGLEPMAKQHDDCKKQLAELTRQRENLTKEVANLEEKYKLLNPLVKDLEKREQDLSRRTKDMDTMAEKAEKAIATLNKEEKRLLDIGLSIEAIAEFSQRVQAIAQLHHILPAELRDRLLQELGNLDQAIGLEALITKRQSELEKQEQVIAKTRQDSENLKAVIASLKQEKESLEASIKNTREKVSKEIAKITPMATDTINRLVEELRRGQSEALLEVQRLKNEAIEVGKNLGRYEEILQANDWLNGLLDLVRGDESLEGGQIRVIALPVVRGAAVWLKHNKGNNLVLSPLLSAAENLVRELERWQA